MKKFVCPRCKSTKIIREVDFMADLRYRLPTQVCQKCGARGLFPLAKDKERGKK